MHDDIIGIINSNGTRIVSYTYDSWGNIISIKDTNNQEISQVDYTNIANINPFRYRSYYYDVETRLYYLNHRYYNPRINRFISPDIILGDNQDIISFNQYAYVCNNPINAEDINGKKKSKKKKNTKKKETKKKKQANIFGNAIKQATSATAISVNTIVASTPINNSTSSSGGIGIKTIAEYSAGFGWGTSVDVTTVKSGNVIKKTISHGTKQGLFSSDSPEYYQYISEEGSLKIGLLSIDAGMINEDISMNGFAPFWEYLQNKNTQYILGISGGPTNNPLINYSLTSDDSTFVGLAVDWYALIGFSFKIGFIIE